MQNGDLEISKSDEIKSKEEGKWFMCFISLYFITDINKLLFNWMGANERERAQGQNQFWNWIVEKAYLQTSGETI